MCGVLPLAKTVHFSMVIIISRRATLVLFIGGGRMCESIYDKTL